jgi:hypothetical protein
MCFLCCRSWFSVRQLCRAHFGATWPYCQASHRPSYNPRLFVPLKKHLVGEGLQQTQTWIKLSPPGCRYLTQIYYTLAYKPWSHSWDKFLMSTAVWCVPSATHVPCLSRSQSKVVVSACSLPHFLNFLLYRVAQLSDLQFRTGRRFRFLPREQRSGSVVCRHLTSLLNRPQRRESSFKSCHSPWRIASVSETNAEKLNTNGDVSEIFSPWSNESGEGWLPRHTSLIHGTCARAPEIRMPHTHTKLWNEEGGNISVECAAEVLFLLRLTLHNAFRITCT